MSPKLLALTAVAVLGLAGAVQAGGPGHATPEEVVGKVREAARYLAEAGGDGLARFKGKGSEYVWKDTYVFVADCHKRTIVAHPIMPERDGKPIADGPTYGGVTAGQRADAQCRAARCPAAAGSSIRSPSRARRGRRGRSPTGWRCPGPPCVVGAGVYDETVTLEQLQAVSGGNSADRMRAEARPSRHFQSPTSPD